MFLEPVHKFLIREQEARSPHQKKTAVVTRPLGQSAALRQMLAEHDIETFEFPLFEIAPVADSAPLTHAFKQLEQYALVIFSAPNAVHYALSHMPTGRWPRSVPIGVVGPGSARALASHGIAAPKHRVIAPPLQGPADRAHYAEAVGSEALARALEQALGLAALAGRRVLILRAERGREWLAEVLRAHHAQVDIVTAYQCRPVIPTASQWTRIHALLAGQPHAWLLTSSSGVRHLASLAQKQLNTPSQKCLRYAPVVVLHARIAHAARAAGFVRIMQASLSDQSVVHALLASIRSFSCL